MSRGYRGIVLAAFGWLILAAQAPHPKAEAQQNQADAQPRNTVAPPGAVRVEVVNQTPDPQGYQDPCEPGQDQRNSDLCAQWKAADAASNAAYYARLQLWAAGAGMLGLVTTILLTFRAVRAAQQSVAVAQETAKHELRAYVGVEEISFSQFGDPSHRRSVSFKEHYRLYVTLKNFGKTPAILTWDADAQRGGEQPRPASLPRPGGAPQILQPGRTVRRIFEVQDIEGGERRLFAIIRIFYTDIYGIGYGHRVDYASAGEEVRNSYLECTHEGETPHPPTPEQEGG